MGGSLVTASSGVGVTAGSSSEGEELVGEVAGAKEVGSGMPVGMIFPGAVKRGSEELFAPKEQVMVTKATNNPASKD